MVEELHQTKRLLSQAQNQSRQLIEELETKQALAAQVHSEKDAQIKRLKYVHISSYLQTSCVFDI